MSQRRRRILTSDEQALWAHVTQQVSPLAARARARRKAEAAEGELLAAQAEGDVVPAPPSSGESGSTRAGLAPGKGAGKGVAEGAGIAPPKTPGKFRKPAWKQGASGGSAAPPAQPPSPPSPPLAPLERRLRQRLARGSHPIDAVIDLHGLRQDEAHMALRSFLHAAQRQGHTVVLVVTGKGGAPSQGGGLFEERGVLRRTVPHWLRLPDLRSVVVGFEEAVQHHGGGGALYVRIRRARTAE